MKSAKAFAPANVSCIFGIYAHKNPRWRGSYGIGFTLKKGVTAEVSKSNKGKVIFNNKKINFPSVNVVIRKLTNEKLTVRIKSDLPLGFGFGLSGASALAVAYATNQLLKLNKSMKALAIISHTADVESKSGLGDVVNQFYGGFLIKLKPSSYFMVNKIKINDYVYCRCFGKMSTKSVISNPKIRNKINNAASAALKNAKMMIRGNKKIKFSKIISISKEFSTNSGLLKSKKLQNIIKNIESDGGAASMIMLGDSIFSDKPFKGAAKFKISDGGAHSL